EEACTIRILVLNPSANCIPAMFATTTSRFANDSALDLPLGVRPPRWTACLGGPVIRGATTGRIVVGLLPGEGVGPEVVGCALEVLERVASATGLQVDLREGGVIGRSAEQTCGTALSAEVIQFCEEVFAKGGAILNGPGGGRYVYDLRKRFDLFFKISPL